MYMVNIVDFNGEFKYFEPSAKAAEIARSLCAKAEYENNAYSRNPAPVLPPITGTFIYAHPPDYRGVPTLDWNTSQWKELFGKLKAAGLNTVIFQAALWNELEECYYRSERFKHFRIYPVLEAMLPAAEACAMELFIGTYGSISGQVETSDPEKEFAAQLDCLHEVSKLCQGNWNLYLPQEALITAPRNMELEKFMRNLMKCVFDEFRRISPNGRILMSPATMATAENEHVAGWLDIFSETKPDILAPQDSIGTCCCTLPHGKNMWRKWREIADRCGIELWANIEIFERISVVGATPFSMASEKRIKLQTDNAAEFVSKIICWEYPFFKLLED